jgi:Ca2+-binding RTX toxin-like protein
MATFKGDASAQTFTATAGKDVLTYLASTSGVTIDLMLGKGFGGFAAGDIYDLSGGWFEVIFGSNFNDIVIGTDNAETISGLNGNDQLFGNGGNDTLIGGDGDDLLVGGTGLDTYFGGNGNDNMVNTASANAFDGGAGSDMVDYSLSTTAVKVDLSTGLGSWGDAEGDRYVSVENVLGGSGNDTIIGGSGGNSLSGKSGDDILIGNDGNDTIIGGVGSDTLTGGAGFDTFQFFASAESNASGRDTITDFTIGSDKIVLNFDADTTLLGEQEFSFGGMGTTNAREVGFEAIAGGVRVYAHTDGDGVADFQVDILGLASVSASDIILV